MGMYWPLCSASQPGGPKVKAGFRRLAQGPWVGGKMGWILHKERVNKLLQNKCPFWRTESAANLQVTAIVHIHPLLHLPLSPPFIFSPSHSHYLDCRLCGEGYCNSFYLCYSVNCRVHRWNSVNKKQTNQTSTELPHLVLCLRVFM